VAIRSDIYPTIDSGTAGPAAVILLAAEGADDPRRAGTVALLRAGALAPSIWRIPRLSSLAARCLSDNEGRSASAVAGRAECGCSTPNRSGWRAAAASPCDRKTDHPRATVAGGWSLRISSTAIAHTVTEHTIVVRCSADRS
jgi:hypothetical protein